MSKDFVIHDIRIKCVGSHPTDGTVAKSKDGTVTIIGEKENVEEVARSLNNLPDLVKAAQNTRSTASILLTELFESPPVLLRAYALRNVVKVLQRALKSFY